MNHRELLFQNLSLLFIGLVVAGCGNSTVVPTPVPSTPTFIPPTTIPPAGWACSSPASAAWGGAGAGDEYFPLWGNGGYDVQHYLIDLKIEMDSNTVIAETTLKAIATQPLEAFNLDFLGMDISHLTVNDTDAAYCRDDSGELTIQLAKPVSKGDALTIFIAYSGKPVLKKPEVQRFFSGWNRLADEVFTIATPDNPAFLYPNNEGANDFAAYTIRVTVPEDYQAITIGSLDQTIVGEGVVTTIWNVNKPIIGGSFLSVDRYPISKTLAGPEGLPIHLDFPSTLPEYYQDEFEIVPDLLTFYTSIFGPFPYETLGINWVNNYPIAAATAPTRIFINSDLGDVKWYLEHEVSHQWFGLSIAPSGLQETWLVEGFASYAPILWDEHQGISADESIRNLYMQLPDRTGQPANPTMDELFAGSETVYDRPAVALHALRLRIGDEKFFALLKTYVNRYQYSIVTTQDFIALAEEVSGQKLDDFFTEWLFEESVPDIPQLNLTKNVEP